ncbi:MAG: hypothetical protein JNJ48_03635 [Phycisphaerae bacterium]|nr:hypothetical protein [Phycisphaerae bacterium]
MAQTPGVSRAMLTWADLAQDLLWPRVLRTFGLAMSPSRLGLMLFALTALMVLDRGWHAAAGWPGSSPGPIASAAGHAVGSLAEAAAGLARLDGQAFGEAVYGLVMGGPAAALRTHPWAMVVLLPLVLVIVSVAGGAVCRSAACEFSMGIRLPWPEAIGFALRRWWLLTAANAAPVIGVWLVSAVLVALGWLVQVAVINILVGAAFALVLVAALVAALLMLGVALAHPLLPAAIACEGTDAYDAVQRAYSYTLNRFGRLVLYYGVLAVQSLVAITVVSAVVLAALTLAQRTTGLSVVPRGDSASGAAVRMLERVTGGAQAETPRAAPSAEPEPLPALRSTGSEAPSATPEDAAGWTDRLAARMARFWASIPLALVSALALSMYFCGSTVVYLLMRQVCDGQDAAELWMPGMVGGTLTAGHPVGNADGATGP